MGVFGAMQTAVSGMQVQSYALENISGNIANSQTVGYKRIDTNFQDLVPDLDSESQLAGGVGATSRSANSLAGAFQSTGVASDIALSGDGYFVVDTKDMNASGTNQFSTEQRYTRRGDFRLDQNNNLVNGSGYYLMGSKIDPVTGTVSGTVPTTIQLPTTDLAPVATTTVTYQGNLPSIPENESNGTGLITATAAGTTVTAANEQAFLGKTIPGGTLTVYDKMGASSSLQLRWGKTATGTWDAYYLSDSKATGTGAKWTSLGNLASFDSAGKLTSSATPSITNLTIDGTNLGTVTMNLTGTTQFGDSSGNLKQTNITQDGHSSASFNGMTINGQGRVFAKYSNGMQVAVADISVAHFNGDESLKRLDGGAFEQTQQSGNPILGANGTTFMSGGVEMSNADISQEFTRMITTQQAYSANAKVITAAQQMLTEAVNIIR